MGKTNKRQRKFLSKKGQLKVTVGKRKHDQSISRKRQRQVEQHTKRAKSAEAERKEIEHEKAQLALLNTDDFIDGGFARAMEAMEADGSNASESESQDDDFAAQMNQLSSESSGDDQSDQSDDDDDETSLTMNSKELRERDREVDKAIGKKKRARETLHNEVESHKKTLSELKARDPDFYKYLEEANDGLLDFDEMLSDDDDDDKEVSAKRDATTLRLKTVRRWIGELNRDGPSFKRVHQMLVAFRCAVMSGTEADPDAEPLPFTIVKPSVINEIVVYCLSEMSGFFERMLDNSDLDRLRCHDAKQKEHADAGDDDGSDSDDSVVAAQRRAADEGAQLKKLKKKLPMARKGWKRLKPLVRSYVTNLMQFVQTAGDASLATFALRHGEAAVPFIVSFRGKAKKWLKVVLAAWTSGKSETGRIMAFFNVRALALRAPYPFLDECLRAIYLAYARSAKFVSKATLPGINFMANCVVELYGIDFVSSYQQAFVFVRQLAIHLRKATHTHERNHAQAVCNWQYVNSLKLWVSLLCSFPDQPELGHLIYPLTQIIIGTLRLAVSPATYPLRLFCVNLLNELSRTNSDVYISTMPFVLDVLEHCTGPLPASVSRAELSKTKDKPPELLTQIKISKRHVHTRVTKAVLFDRSLELLLNNFYNFAYTVAFPELVVAARIRLRTIAKPCRVPVYRKRIGLFLSKLAGQAAWIEQRRSKLSVTPTTITRIDPFLPQGAITDKSSPIEAYVRQFKASLAAQRAQLIESARRPKRSSKGDNDDSDDDDRESSRSSFEGKGKGKPKARPESTRSVAARPPPKQRQRKRASFPKEVTGSLDDQDVVGQFSLDDF
jgi:nucleolar complex protein 2